MSKAKFKVVGGEEEFDVVEIIGKRSAILYDLLPRQEATAICRILKRGIGPEWDAVEAELSK